MNAPVRSRRTPRVAYSRTLPVRWDGIEADGYVTVLSSWLRSYRQRAAGRLSPAIYWSVALANPQGMPGLNHFAHLA